MMEVRAYLKGARLSPQKAALVADMIRGLDVEKALDILSFSKQKERAHLHIIVRDKIRRGL